MRLAWGPERRAGVSALAGSNEADGGRGGVPSETSDTSNAVDANTKKPPTPTSRKKKKKKKPSTDGQVRA